MNVFLKAIKPEKLLKFRTLLSSSKIRDFVYLSGQIPLNPETGEIEGTTIEEQTHRNENIKVVLEEMDLIIVTS